jgi:hypothetical protein
MRLVGRALLLLFFPAVSLFAAGDDYVIRFTRPAKVGDRSRVEMTGTTRERERITIGGQVQKEEKDLAVHMIAVESVLAVDSSSTPSRVEYLVQTCQRTSAGKTEELLAAGHKVVAETNAEGDTVFTVDGDPALEDIAKALGLVISIHRPSSPTDDDIFGTKERKRVGDTWNIDSAAAAADLSKTGLMVSAEALKGTVSLTGVRSVDAVKALDVTAKLRAEGFAMAGGDLPEWLQVEKSSLAGDLKVLVPADPDAPNSLPGKLQMQIVVLLKGEKPDTGSPVTIEETMEMSMENATLPMRDIDKAPPGPVEF